MAELGTRLMDWIINALDSTEKIFWPWANTDVAAVCGGSWKFTEGGSGLFGLWEDVGAAVSKLIDCVWAGLKWALGAIPYYVLHGLKALVCMLRAGRTAPGMFDYTTYSPIFIVQYVWKALKNLRLSSPDYLGFQIVLPDMEDLFDTILSYLGTISFQGEVPGIPESIECYLSGVVTQVQFECWMKLNDCSPAVWGPVIQSRRDQLRTDEKIDSIRRKSIPSGFTWRGLSIASTTDTDRERQWQADSVASLRYVGWINSDEAAQRVALYDEIPTISEHLHWLARNIDVYDYVRDYHLLDGFDDPAVVASLFPGVGYQVLPQAAGRNFWEEFGGELRSQGRRKVDALRDYASHWLHGSPGQSREFAWRLRGPRPLVEGENIDPSLVTASPAGPVVWPEAWQATRAVQLAAKEASWESILRQLTFSAEDFGRLLSEQDYGYLDVEWFKATMYHVPALSYVRDMYRYGIIEETELGAYHQALGYSETDSARFVAVDSSIKQRIRTAESFGWTPSALSRSYGLNQIDKPFAQAEMARQGFTPSETDGMLSRASKTQQARILTRALGRVLTRTITQVSAGYNAGVLDRPAALDGLTGLGVPEKQAKAILDMEDLKVRTRLSSELQRTVRSAFLKGKINETQAIQLMQEASIAQPQIDALIQMWKLEMMQTEKHLSVAQIRRAVIDGTMTVEEARVRITNLGYPDADAQILAEEIQAAASDAEIRAATVHDRISQLEQNALARSAKAAQAAQQRAVQALQRKEPPSKLQRWAEMGLVTQAYFTSRLQLYGYDDTTIGLLWEEACRRKGATCQNGAV